MVQILKTTEKRLSGKQKMSHHGTHRTPHDGRKKMENTPDQPNFSSPDDSSERAVLAQLMEELKLLRQSGALKALVEYAEVLTAMKQSLTKARVGETAVRITQLVERIDDIAQRGALEGLTSLIQAYDRAVLEREDHRRPASLFRLLRLVIDPAVRDKAALMLWTLKFWCDELPTKDLKKDATNG